MQNNIALNVPQSLNFPNKYQECIFVATTNCKRRLRAYFLTSNFIYLPNFKIKVNLRKQIYRDAWIIVQQCFINDAKQRFLNSLWVILAASFSWEITRVRGVQDYAENYLPVADDQSAQVCCHTLLLVIPEHSSEVDSKTCQRQETILS